MSDLSKRIQSEAEMAARPGQCGRLLAIAADVAAVEADRDRLKRGGKEALRKRLATLIAPYQCHQCGGSGECDPSESAPVRLVGSKPESRPCPPCKGTGQIEPIAVETTKIRAALEELA